MSTKYLLQGDTNIFTSTSEYIIPPASSAFAQESFSSGTSLENLQKEMFIEHANQMPKPPQPQLVYASGNQHRQGSALTCQVACIAPDLDGPLVWWTLM